MDEKTIIKDLATTPKGIVQNNDPEYVRHVSLISGLWEKAREKAALAVNTEYFIFARHRRANWRLENCK